MVYNEIYAALLFVMQRVILHLWELEWIEWIVYTTKKWLIILFLTQVRTKIFHFQIIFLMISFPCFYPSFPIHSSKPANSKRPSVQTDQSLASFWQLLILFSYHHVHVHSWVRVTCMICINTSANDN